jgi:uncharacterized protein YndB with AHSA1/START domain
MSGSKFLYVTFIRSTPEKVWEALIKPEFAQTYWFGMWIESDWKKGSPWKLIKADGFVADEGEVLEIERPRKLVLKWRNVFRPELAEEGFARATLEIEPAGESVKLTVTHEMDTPGSKLIEAVAGGWPAILSSLKSLLETGAALPRPTSV